MREFSVKKFWKSRISFLWQWKSTWHWKFRTQELEHRIAFSTTGAVKFDEITLWHPKEFPKNDIQASSEKYVNSVMKWLSSVIPIKLNAYCILDSVFKILEKNTKGTWEEWSNWLPQNCTMFAWQCLLGQARKWFKTTLNTYGPDIKDAEESPTKSPQHNIYIGDIRKMACVHHFISKNLDVLGTSARDLDSFPQ